MVKNKSKSTLKPIESFRAKNHIAITATPIAKRPVDMPAYCKLVQSTKGMNTRLDCETGLELLQTVYRSYDARDERLLDHDSFELLLKKDVISTNAADKALVLMLRLSQVRRTVTTVTKRQRQYGGDYSVAEHITLYRAFTLEMDSDGLTREFYSHICRVWVPQLFKCAAQAEGSVDQQVKMNSAVLRRLMLANDFSGLESLNHALPPGTSEQKLQTMLKDLEQEDHGIRFLMDRIVVDDWLPADAMGANLLKQLEYMTNRSTKLKALAGILDFHVVQRREKVLISMEYPAYQWVVEDFCILAGMRIASLKASQSDEARAVIFSEFNDPTLDKYDLLISTNALLQLGHNIQGACHVIVLMDSTKTEAMTQQLIGRVYRIGQRHEVYAYMLHNQHSVDRYVEGNNAFKFQASLIALASNNFRPHVLKAWEVVCVLLICIFVTLENCRLPARTFVACPLAQLHFCCLIKLSPTRSALLLPHKSVPIRSTLLSPHKFVSIYTTLLLPHKNVFYVHFSHLTKNILSLRFCELTRKIPGCVSSTTLTVKDTKEFRDPKG
ncbi:uncharacterized protein K452DRAFT_331737 [Aplosporella prunicola CBS 121167]|uniref:Helicase C-terminal domain-containing protein n=1 Tax=Aplosporella prunicola CBS 121167 TaxID=1176127 RepID=A0A6A6BKH2_9PEZI|nr:uncharacterized protein K452DRAFT_331737 [Aplosporella prunicola CBS 121167]KAF2143071.1 hypothetical protein K452DRAFT_331737 [Aplosporella prunicola CBS 121167]